MVSSSLEQVCEVVKCLGGPDVSPKDLEWADAIPAGRELLALITQQLRSQSLTDGPLPPPLRRIALEREEADLLAVTVTDHDHVKVEASAYKIPSAQNFTNELRDRELKLLQAEAARLNARLHLVKKTSHQVLQTRKMLKDAIHNTASSIRSHQGRLDGLTSQIDSALSIAVSHANTLLDRSICNSETLQEYKDRVSCLALELRTIVDAASEGARKIVHARASLPGPSYVQAESSRLFEKLQKSNVKDRHSDIIDLVLEDELLAICERLENTDDETIDDVIADLTLPGVELSLQHLWDVDIRAAVESAWNMDQMALLISKEKVLNEGQTALDTRLSERLLQLQQDLSSKVDSNFEAEALVSALLEEIEDAIGDIEEAKDPSVTISGDKEVMKPHVHREKLKVTLKDLQSYRPAHAEPLILLNDADVDTELISVAERLRSARTAEEDWLATLATQLPDLEHPLLSVVYANSPLNTSPPFTAPAELCESEIAARSNIDSMTRSIVALQKDIELGDRAKRKLTHFVESRVGKH